jgi:hypothetical protein
MPLLTIIVEYELLLLLEEKNYNYSASAEPATIVVTADTIVLYLNGPKRTETTTGTRKTLPRFRRP